MARFLHWTRDFIHELRRRRVLRVAAVYAGTAFVLLQLGEILVEPFGLPDWTLRMVTFLLVLGFPLAVGLAWVFDVTETGLVRTEDKGAAVREIGPGGKPLTSNVAIIGLLVLITGLLLYPYVFGAAQQEAASVEPPRRAGPHEPATARLGPKSVAVLPFTYLSTADSTDYFSVGMADELLMRLSQIGTLSVIARTSVMKYRGATKTIPEISRELGVAYLVEGSVQKVGGQVRIQVQLVDGRTGVHEWATSYTRRMENVLRLQGRLARQIARKLEATIQPSEKRQLSTERTVDSTAYALYLQARTLRFQETGSSVVEAVRLLRQSVALDSTFAPAWAVLSTAAWLGPALGGELSPRLHGDSLAREAARRALALDSTSAEAHVAMGVVQQLDGDYPRAGEHFKRALELNPGLANGYREFGLYLMRMGQFEGAARLLRNAAWLDPASPRVFRDLGENNLYQGRYERAKRQLEKALTLQSDFTWVRHTVWEAYVAQDSARTARKVFEQAIATDSVGWTLATLRAYSRTGRRQLAERAARRLRDTVESPYLQAGAYAHLGAPDTAMRLLRESGWFEELHYHSVKVDPLLRPLWTEPAFQRELDTLGLDDATVQQTMERLAPLRPNEVPKRLREGKGNFPDSPLHSNGRISS